MNHARTLSHAASGEWVRWTAPVSPAAGRVPRRLRSGWVGPPKMLAFLGTPLARTLAPAQRASARSGSGLAPASPVHQGQTVLARPPHVGLDPPLPAGGASRRARPERRDASLERPERCREPHPEPGHATCVARTIVGVLLVIVAYTPSQAAESEHSHHQPSDVATRRLQAALAKRPNDPVLHYNLGTLAHRRGDYDTAATSLQQALAAAGPSLQGRVAYNLGNTLYRQAQSKEQTAPRDGATLYQRALEDYRLAIQRHPGDRDAVFNYELVQRRLEQLQSQTAQQQQHASGASRKEHEQHAQASAQQSSASQAPSGEEKPQDATRLQELARSGDEQQPQAQAMKSGEGSSQDGKEMSKQETLWILDSLKSAERKSPLLLQREQAQERSVEQDW